MAEFRCPGQDMRFWKPEDIFEEPCPFCGEAVEFWKDEPRERCGHCGKRVMNPRIDLGCAKWCKYAAQCVGASSLPDANESLCDILIKEMKQAVGGDKARIRHALGILRHAEKILQQAEADPLVVQATAILYDIARPHGKDDVGMIRDMLRKAGVDDARAGHICRIIATHHGSDDVDTPEFRIIREADRLARASGSPNED